MPGHCMAMLYNTPCTIQKLLCEYWKQVCTVLGLFHMFGLATCNIVDDFTKETAN